MSLQKFLELNWEPKVIYTDNPLEIGKDCEDLSRNHCTPTPQRSETVGFAERAVRRAKRWHLCCIVAFKSRFNRMLLLAAKRSRSLLVHCLRITLLIRKTSQESINLERKSDLDCSSDTICTRGGIWKGDILVADIEESETKDTSEIHAIRLNAKELLTPQRCGNFIL